MADIVFSLGIDLLKKLHHPVRAINASLGKQNKRKRASFRPVLSIPYTF